MSNELVEAFEAWLLQTGASKLNLHKKPSGEYTEQLTRYQWGAFRAGQIAALAAHKAKPDGWMDIESAPEDGSYFLIWCEQEGCQNNKSRPLVTRVKDGLYEGLMFFDEPTHYRPITKPNNGDNHE